MQLCTAIMTMEAYRRAADAEKDGKKLSPSDLRLLVSLERQAGLRRQGLEPEAEAALRRLTGH